MNTHHEQVEHVAESYRNALALLAVRDEADTELIARDMCWGCTLQAALGMLGSFVDRVWEGDVAAFNVAVMKGLDL